MTEKTTHLFPSRRLLGSRGQAFALFAILLPIFLGMTTMAVEVGMVYMAKNQLQIAADAAALSSVQELIADDIPGARGRAVATAASNRVGRRAVTINPNTDVELGRWENGRFTPDPVTPNAIRVTARRTGASPDGPVPLYFARLLGFDNVDIIASAIAKLASIDLMLVLDRSKSMDGDTVYQRVNGRRVPVNGIQPMDTMRDAAKSFIDDLEEGVDNVGVVSYSSNASSPIDQVLTDSHPAAKTAIDNIPQPNGYTNIGDGIEKALQEFRSARGRRSPTKILILLSDGAPTCNAQGTCNFNGGTALAGRAFALAKANEARAMDVLIHTISLGSGADRTLMQDIAQRTGGEEFFASGGADLSRVFAEIRSRIPVQLAN